MLSLHSYVSTTHGGMDYTDYSCKSAHVKCLQSLYNT